MDVWQPYVAEPDNGAFVDLPSSWPLPSVRHRTFRLQIFSLPLSQPTALQCSKATSTLAALPHMVAKVEGGGQKGRCASLELA